MRGSKHLVQPPDRCGRNHRTIRNLVCRHLCNSVILADQEHRVQIWRELGNGDVHWDEVRERLLWLEEVGWAMVEQDHSDRAPAESIKMSRNFLPTQYSY